MDAIGPVYYNTFLFLSKEVTEQSQSMINPYSPEALLSVFKYVSFCIS